MSPLPALGIFANAPSVGNSFESIQTVTVGAGGSSSVSFTSIPSSYKHLQIRGIGRVSTGVDAAVMRFNSDTSSSYAYHRLTGNGTAAGAGGAASSNGISILSQSGFPAAANTFAAVVIDILDYANTSKNKTVRTLDGFDANGSGGVAFESGAWLTGTAISSITLTPSTYPWQQYTTFALYGIKG